MGEPSVSLVQAPNDNIDRTQCPAHCCRRGSGELQSLPSDLACESQGISTQSNVCVLPTSFYVVPFKPNPWLILLWQEPPSYKYI